MIESFTKKLWTFKNEHHTRLWNCVRVNKGIAKFVNSCVNFAFAKIDWFHHTFTFLLALPWFLGPNDMLLQTPLCILKTYFKPLQTFYSIIAYWHVLKNAWSKQVYKLSSKPNIPQLTTKLSDVVIILTINPSSFTHATLFFFKSHFLNNLVKFCSTIFMISKMF
jgi:hypothetical protein